MAPLNYAREAKFEFKERTMLGLPGSALYGGVFTFAPWSDNSGGVHHQLGFINQSIFYRTGLPQASSWGGWFQLILANDSGNVGIGTSNPGHKLDVIGTVRAQEVKVDMIGADFVFEEDYDLMPLAELETFIRRHKHLPEIQPASEMATTGVELGVLNSKLLQKTEELTLYILQQQKEIEILKSENKLLLELESRIQNLEKNSRRK